MQRGSLTWNSKFLSAPSSQRKHLFPLISQHRAWVVLSNAAHKISSSLSLYIYISEPYKDKNDWLFLLPPPPSIEATSDSSTVGLNQRKCGPDRLSLQSFPFPNTQVTIGSHAGMLQRHSDFENADGEWEGDSISLNRDPELSLRIGSISPGCALQNADCASTVNYSRGRGCR